MTTQNPKVGRLKDIGVLNPHPERVRAPAFLTDDFFDPRDLVQVRYEMLRHVRSGRATKVEAAKLFGVTRPTYYQAESAYDRDGLAGLLPRRRGPRGAHKLDERVMAFIGEQRSRDDAPGVAQLCALIREEFGLSVHPRSVQRALARKKNAG